MDILNNVHYLHGMKRVQARKLASQLLDVVEYADAVKILEEVQSVTFEAGEIQNHRNLTEKEYESLRAGGFI